MASAGRFWPWGPLGIVAPLGAGFGLTASYLKDLAEMTPIQPYPEGPASDMQTRKPVIAVGDLYGGQD